MCFSQYAGCGVSRVTTGSRIVSSGQLVCNAHFMNAQWATSAYQSHGILRFYSWLCWQSHVSIVCAFLCLKWFCKQIFKIRKWKISTDEGFVGKNPIQCLLLLLWNVAQIVWTCSFLLVFLVLSKHLLSHICSVSLVVQGGFLGVLRTCFQSCVAHLVLFRNTFVCILHAFASADTGNSGK